MQSTPTSPALASFESIPRTINITEVWVRGLHRRQSADLICYGALCANVIYVPSIDANGAINGCGDEGMTMTTLWRAEVLNLKAGNLSQEGDAIYCVYRGKGGKQGKRELPQPVSYALKTVSRTSYLPPVAVSLGTAIQLILLYR